MILGPFFLQASTTVLPQECFNVRMPARLMTVSHLVISVMGLVSAVMDQMSTSVVSLIEYFLLSIVLKPNIQIIEKFLFSFKFTIERKTYKF